MKIIPAVNTDKESCYGCSAIETVYLLMRGHRLCEACAKDFFEPERRRAKPHLEAIYLTMLEGDQT